MGVRDVHDEDQFASSLNSQIANEIINFLLSTKGNSKVIGAKVNEILYNYIMNRVVQLGISVSEYIKRLIIKDMLEHGHIKLDKPSQINSIVFSNTKKRRNDGGFIDKKTKKVLIQKLNGRKIKREITEIKRELDSLYDEVRRYHREKMKYRYIVPPQYNALSNRLEILRERVLQLLKQNIPAHFIDDLNEIIDKINDIEELLEA